MTKITSWELEEINEERCPKYTWRRLLYIVEILKMFYYLLSIAFLEHITLSLFQLEIRIAYLT